jgi:hypothetical protein
MILKDDTEQFLTDDIEYCKCFYEKYVHGFINFHISNKRWPMSLKNEIWLSHLI